MEAQAQEIGHIRTLEAELKKNTELFTDMTQQLVTASQELAHTGEAFQHPHYPMLHTAPPSHHSARERVAAVPNDISHQD